jgi:ribonuclease HI
LSADRREKIYRLFTDGSSLDNPGPAGAGAVLLDSCGQIAFRVGLYLGRATNNVAEYAGLILGIEKTLEYGLTTIDIFADSMLVVNQIKGLYRVSAPHLLEPFQRACAILSYFESWSINYVSRKYNKLADKMAVAAAELGRGGSLCPGGLLQSEEFLYSLP